VNFHTVAEPAEVAAPHEEDTSMKSRTYIEHRTRRMIALASLAVAVGVFALAGARPAHAGAPPDLTVDTPTFVFLPANVYGSHIPGWWLIFNVRNTGGSDVNQPFRVAVIVSGAVDWNKTYTINSLAAGAGKGAMIWVGVCPPGDWLSATVYVDIDDHIDEWSDSVGSNQAGRHKSC